MNNEIIVKSLLIWLGITPLAILNGALREYFLIPMLGTLALSISGVILMLCIFAISYVFIPRLGTGNKQTYIKMGLVWVLATLVFETLLGIVVGTPFHEMLQAYNIFTGNAWLFLVIFIGFVPTIVARMKNITESRPIKQN